ncbi:hypothetical protein HZB78_03555 [Candidatus Collierbacteria bacterium]|nr:hypothetical protein [Candidatus Collierbacteria bacterium]
MTELLELATIKIDLKMQGNFLAKVTLNWRDEFEVRFFRILRSSTGKAWLQPPCLEKFGWAKCFGVLDRDNWKEFMSRVIVQFKEELKEKVKEGTYSPAVLRKIEEAEDESIDLNDIPDDLGGVNIKPIRTYENK